MKLSATLHVSLQGAPSTFRGQIATLLVGHPSDQVGSGPFQRAGTSVYICDLGDQASVIQALLSVANLLARNPANLDNLSLIIAGQRTAKGTGSAVNQSRKGPVTKPADGLQTIESGAI